jgi:hypothetical protein
MPVCGGKIPCTLDQAPWSPARAAPEGRPPALDLTDPAAAAEKLKIGTRVTTKFAPERKGEMLDFWFEIAG